MNMASMPIESAEYRRAREELLAAERALIDQREAVAALRRALPPGRLVETDYVFREGPAQLGDGADEATFETRFSDLFAAGKDDLIVVHLMFGANAESACPMCTMWADGYDGVAHHVADKTNLVLVARADIAALRAWARGRGWRRLRLLSSRDNDFNRDFGVEESADDQYPGVSVFRRQPDGVIRHVYTSEGSLVYQHHRALDLFTPVFNLFDLLPDGRGDWMPRTSYG